MKELIITICITILLILSGCTKIDSERTIHLEQQEKKEMSIDERVEDFQYILNVIKTSYPFFEEEKRVKGIDVLALEDKYIERVKKAKSDYEFWVILNCFFAEIPSCHTDILFPYWEDYMYINCYGIKLIQKDKQIENITSQWEAYIKAEEEKQKIESYIIFEYIQGEYLLNNEGAKALNNVFKVGTSLLEVDGLGVEEFLRQQGSGMYVRYDHIRKQKYRARIILNNEKGKDVSVKIKTVKGNIKELTMKYDSKIELGRTTTPIEGYNLEDLYSQDIKDLDTYYIRVRGFRKCHSTKIKKMIKEGKNYQNMIIDIRDNTGGSPLVFIDNILACLSNKPIVCTRQWKMQESNFNMDIIKELDIVNKYFNSFKKEDGWYLKKDIIGSIPRSMKQYEGNIYVLINNRTASAADFMVSEMKKKPNVVVIGTNTDGEGTAHTFNVLALPNSRLVMSYMPGYSLNDEGLCNSIYGTAPDLVVEQSKEDYLERLLALSQGKATTFENVVNDDTVLKYCLNKISNR